MAASKTKALDMESFRNAFTDPTKKREKPSGDGANTLGKIGCGALVLLALVGIFRSFVVVGAGERAVVFSIASGVQPLALGEGLHFLMPFVQSATVYDVKTHNYTMSGNKNEGSASGNLTGSGADDSLVALTQDGLPVSLEISVQFHPEVEKVPRLHQNIGPLYIEKIVRPQIRAHVRMVVAQYPVTDVYGARRARISDEINARLRKAFAANDIVLENALLRDVSFSPQFQEAIEQKQVALQEVQRMEFVVQQADKERRRKIIEAEGEAESIRLKAVALSKNPQLTQYEYVQRLPENVPTIITNNRTILNMDGAPASPAAAVTAETPSTQPRRAAPPQGATP